MERGELKQRPETTKLQNTTKPKKNKPRSKEEQTKIRNEHRRRHYQKHKEKIKEKTKLYKPNPRTKRKEKKKGQRETSTISKKTDQRTCNRIHQRKKEELTTKPTGKYYEKKKTN